MARHIADQRTPRAFDGRLPAFVEILRRTGPHRAARALHARAPRVALAGQSRLAQFLRIARGHGA